MRMRETQGFMKIVVDAQSNEIPGILFLGHNNKEVVQIALAAAANGGGGYG